MRSLVPKEKKSAASAIRCAVSAARGNSIIVPIGMSRVTPFAAATSARMPSASSRTRCSSITEPTSGTMISTFGCLPARTRSLAASAMARTCSANNPGVSRPSRTPRNPSIGFDSCRRSTAASTRLSSSSRGAALTQGLGDGHLDGQLGAVGKELVQRRVQQPDRHRQPVHRGEQLDEVLALQRQQRIQRSVPRRRRCRPGSPARSATAGHPGTCARCGTARCPAHPATGPAPRPPRCPRSPGSPAAAGNRRASAAGRPPFTSAAISSSAPATAASRPCSM